MCPSTVFVYLLTPYIIYVLYTFIDNIDNKSIKGNKTVILEKKQGENAFCASYTRMCEAIVYTGGT